MRVLFLSQIVPYPPHGGVLQRGYHLLRELGRDAKIHLLAFVHPDVLPTTTTLDESRVALGRFCETVEYFPLWAKESKISRGAAVAATLVSRKPFSVVAHRSSAFHRRVEEVMRSAPFDLIHVDTIALSQFIPPDDRRPRALTHHNIESTLMARRAQVERNVLGRAFLRREARKLKTYEATISPSFDINIMVSREDQQSLVDGLPGVETAVVPNGVDTSYFIPGDEDERSALIYTGGMNMFANRDAVMHFLDAVWPLITVTRPDLQFYAVGQDPPAELRQMAARDPRIVVTGYVSDIRPLVRKAAVYVVPLRVGGGTRLKVLDAMAMGKALVSTAIGCEGIAVRDREHLLIANDPQPFARSVLELLGNPERRRALGRAARAVAESTYAWPVIGELLKGAYRSAIESRRRRR